MIRTTCWRIVSIALGLAILVALPTSGRAQPQIEEWDPDRWLDLVTQGDELYNRALEVPEDDEATYRDLLRRSLQAKQAALGMLRSAIIRDQVHNVEQLWDDANRDLFNLQENVIVILLELDQCDAAELQLNQALMDPSILPEGGVEHLEMLLPEVEVCRQFLAEAPPAFDEAGFERYMEQGDQWHQQARVAEEPEEQELALYEASQRYSQALELLRDGLLEGNLSDPFGEREAQLYRIYNGVITILFEMHYCEAASRRILQAIADAEQLPNGQPDDFRTRQAEVETCEAERLAAQTPAEELECTSDLDCVTPQICLNNECVDPGMIDLRPPGQNAKIAAYVLWGVAGAAAITAVTLDGVSGSDRDELDSLRSQCAAGACDYERTVQLSEDLNNRKTTIAVLAGAAIVTAALGTILFFTAPDEQEQPSRSSPRDTADVGVPVFSFDGLGASMNINF